MRRVVDQSMQEFLTEYLELHPDVLDLILSKSLNALKVPFTYLLFYLSPVCFSKSGHQYKVLYYLTLTF